jgi:hypothetical protein
VSLLRIIAHSQLFSGTVMRQKIISAHHSSATSVPHPEGGESASARLALSALGLSRVAGRYLRPLRSLLAWLTSRCNCSLFLTLLPALFSPRFCPGKRYHTVQRDEVHASERGRPHLHPRRPLAGGFGKPIYGRIRSKKCGCGGE